MSGDFSNSPKAGPPELIKLRSAIEGLLYPSESDEPFTVFCWEPKGARESVRDVVAAQARGRNLKQVPVDRFFGDLNESDDAPRFEQLRRTLESTLHGLAIYRVGEGAAEVDVYLIGKTLSGQWAGLHTISVET